MRALSDVALVAAHAAETDEVWLVRLSIDHADILDGPLLFVNDIQDLNVLPTNIIAEPDLSLWTPVSIGSVEHIGSLLAITDADASAIYRLTSSKTGLTGGTTYTYSLRVKKDDVPRTTRFASMLMENGANTTNFYLDTSTGEFSVVTAGTGHVDAGVIDDGDAWLVYISRTGNTSYTIRFWPARGASATWVTGNAAQGTTYVDRPHLFAGVIADRTTYIAFPFQIDLPGEDPEQPATSRLRIDNVDRQIVEAIRGLSGPPLASLEVVLASQPEVVEIGFYDLTIRSADYDALYVEAGLTYEAIYSEPITFDMTPARFPGLF
jgi:hypothetical protein